MGQLKMTAQDQRGCLGRAGGNKAAGKAELGKAICVVPPCDQKDLSFHSGETQNSKSMLDRASPWPDLQV